MKTIFLIIISAKDEKTLEALLTQLSQNPGRLPL